MRFTVLGFLLFIVTISSAGAGTSSGQAIEIKNKTISSGKGLSNMINFTQQQSVDLWRITNDGVMGGKSQGRFLFEPGKVIFTGDISLDNNGGFSSVFRAIEALPKNLETVTIDIQGDGLTYQLKMIVNLDGYRLAYKHPFKTIAGQRETLTFTLADFQASFRGRNIDNAPVLKAEDIRVVVHNLYQQLIINKALK